LYCPVLFNFQRNVSRAHREEIGLELGKLKKFDCILDGRLEFGVYITTLTVDSKGRKQKRFAIRSYHKDEKAHAKYLESDECRR
jgi:hypothetical protein